MRHQIYATVNAILIRDGSILLSRRANTGWMDGKLALPGGHIEPGEMPRVAVVREVKEEVGLDISQTDASFVCVAHRIRTDREQVAYEFLVNFAGEPRNTEPELCAELVWRPLDDLGDDIIPDFRQVIDDGYNKHNSYLELYSDE